MEASNPVDLFFGGMEKLGPGDDDATLWALHRLPRQDFRLIVDAGCGTGRQTLALAKKLGRRVHAVDSHEPFLEDVRRRAAAQGIDALVQTHCMDMKDIPRFFQGIDLLWSEGAAYNIGFAEALAGWASALSDDGFAVVSELAWLRAVSPPDAVRRYFATAYPGMQETDQNIAAAERAGYRVLGTHELPEEAWIQGYYDILGPKAEALSEHPDAAVRNFARETLEEIDIFRISQGSYGYVFYILQRR